MSPREDERDLIRNPGYWPYRCIPAGWVLIHGVNSYDAEDNEFRNMVRIVMIRYVPASGRRIHCLVDA